MTLDLTNNFDATRLYLNVVTIYVRLMILLSRVEDRKAVLGLFNAAHEMIHGQVGTKIKIFQTVSGGSRDSRLKIWYSHLQGSFGTEFLILDLGDGMAFRISRT